MKRRYFVSVVVVLAVVVCLAGCGDKLVKDKVESSIESSLPGIIGPAQSYNVQAYGSALQIINGKLNGLDIVGINVQLPNGVTVARLNARLNDIRFDPDTREIKSIGRTQYSASLSEKELNRYLKEKYPDIPGMRVDLRDGLVKVTATPTVSMVKVTIEADAGLEVRQRQQIAIDLKKLSVAGIATPSFAREYIENKIDVIFDARDLGYDATIDSVIIGPGSLTLSGEMNLMKALAKRNNP